MHGKFKKKLERFSEKKYSAPINGALSFTILPDFL